MFLSTARTAGEFCLRTVDPQTFHSVKFDKKKGPKPETKRQAGEKLKGNKAKQSVTGKKRVQEKVMSNTKNQEQTWEPQGRQKRRQEQTQQCRQTNKEQELINQRDAGGKKTKTGSGKQWTHEDMTYKIKQEMTKLKPKTKIACYLRSNVTTQVNVNSCVFQLLHRTDIKWSLHSFRVGLDQSSAFMLASSITTRSAMWLLQTAPCVEASLWGTETLWWIWTAEARS